MNRHMGPLTVDDLPPAPPGRTGWPWTEATPVRAQGGVGAGADPRYPRITIVTPSFNQADYLEETIRSILLQSYPDLEYIIVDGGSTDGSVEIIKKYEKHLAWWVSEKDDGQSHAINKGFDRATGEIFNYLSSDDVFEPGAFYTVAQAMAEPGVSWVVGQVRYRRAGAPDWPLAVHDESSFAEWFLWCPVPQPGSFWTADLHRANGRFREDLHFYFDYDFWMRLRFLKNLKPRVLPQDLAVYRLHDQSKTVSNNSAFEREGVRIRQALEPLLTRKEALQLWCARRRFRARKMGGRAMGLVAERKFLPAFGRALSALWLWPPVVIQLGGARRALANRRAAPGQGAPLIWD